jgi:hypothetical protein
MNVMGRLRRAIILVAGILACASPCSAKVVKFEIVRVESPVFEGRSFGAVGTYVRIVARATIAVAPPVVAGVSGAIAKATQQLVRDRLVLEEDAKLFMGVSDQVRY